jgi:hypothetical protein
MKHTHFILSLAAALALFSLILSFVSAPRYEPIFIKILVCNFISMFCLVYVARKEVNWLVMVLILGAIILYSTVDVVLRAAWGVRALDFFR